MSKENNGLLNPDIPFGLGAIETNMCNLLIDGGYEYFVDRLKREISLYGERKRFPYRALLTFISSSWYISDSIKERYTMTIFNTVCDIVSDGIENQNIEKQYEIKHRVFLYFRSAANSLKSVGELETSIERLNRMHNCDFMKNLDNSVTIIYDHVKTLQMQKDTYIKINKATEIKQILEKGIENNWGLHKTLQKYNCTTLGIEGVKKIANEFYPELLDRLHENGLKESSRCFHALMKEHKAFAEDTTSDLDVLDIMLKHPRFFKTDGTINIDWKIFKYAMTDQTAERNLRKWLAKYGKLLKPSSSKEFINSRWITKDGEVEKEVKERAVKFLREKNFPTSLYLMKDVARKIMKTDNVEFK